MKKKIITLIVALAFVCSYTVQTFAASGVIDASGNFTLPTIDSSAEIFWESSDENLIEPVGDTAYVTRPPYGEGIATVVLTAYAVEGDSFSEKNFIVTVEEEEINVEYSSLLKTAAKQFRDEFLLKQNILAIDKNLTIPALSSDMTLTLYSDNPSVVDSEGRVFRRLDTDQRANIYFVISYGYEHFKLSFPLCVKAYTEDEVQAFLTEDADWLDKKMQSFVGTTVISDIALETLAPNNSTIVWSSDSTAINEEGKINRGGDDTLVTLTAKITLEDKTLEKTYSFTVKKKAPTASGGGLSPSGGGQPSGTASGGGSFSSGNTNKSDSGNATVVPPAQALPFGDVPETHWAYDPIKYLYEKGIVSGYDGEFSPDASIKREESIKMILLAAGLPISSVENTSFTDVLSSDWFYPYVMSAFEKGIVNGMGDNLFGVGENVSRQDFSLIVYNAVSDKLGDPTVEKTIFADDADISDYAREAVYALCERGVVKGRDDGCFSPRAGISRAEAAKIIYGVLQIMKGE